MKIQWRRSGSDDHYQYSHLNAGPVVGEHDGDLSEAFFAGQEEWGASLLGAGLNVGTSGEEQLCQISVALLSGKGQRTLSGGGGVT